MTPINPEPFFACLHCQGVYVRQSFNQKYCRAVECQRAHRNANLRAYTLDHAINGRCKRCSKKIPDGESYCVKHKEYVRLENLRRYQRKVKASGKSIKPLSCSNCGETGHNIRTCKNPEREDW